MADKTVTNLTAVTTLADSDLLYVVASGNSRKITAANLKAPLVVGPASATDNAIVRFDAATGKLVQNSSVLVTDGGIIQLGGTTSSFPSIKRNSTALNFRLADDSDDCDITAKSAIFSANVTISSGGLLRYSGSTGIFSPSDGVVRMANNAGSSFNRLQFGDTTAAFPAVGPITTAGGWGLRIPSAADTNGQGLNIQTITELTTIAAAATTDTTILIPASAIVVGVSVRVTVAIPTATAFDYGVAGAITRYGTAVGAALNTTYPGTDDGLRFYASALAIRFTPNVTPGANTGRVRTTIHYITLTPPTS